MSEQNEIIDFNFDASEADIQRPIIKNGYYPLELSTVKQIVSKNNHPMLTVGFKSTTPLPTVDGKEVNPGFFFSTNILLKPTGDLTQEMIEARLKEFHVSLVGPGKVSTQNWPGKVANVQLKLREPSRNETTGEEYPARNEIGSIRPVKKAA